jgi:hypothetical protein
MRNLHVHQLASSILLASTLLLSHQDLALGSKVNTSKDEAQSVPSKGIGAFGAAELTCKTFVTIDSNQAD